MRHTYASLVAT